MTKQSLNSVKLKPLNFQDENNNASFTSAGQTPNSTISIEKRDISQAMQLNINPNTTQMPFINNESSSSEKNPLLYSDIALHKGKRKIVFVHVGKAGGTTITLSVFRHLYCSKMRRAAEVKQACHAQANRTDSPLRESAMMEVHLHPLGPRRLQEVRQKATTFLFTIRNPLERVISSYHFLHYRNSRKSAFARHKNAVRDEFYITCFPEQSNLLRNIHEVMQIAANHKNTTDNRNTTSPLTRCQRLALDGIQGNGEAVKRSNIHLFMNYEKYVAITVDLVPHREIFVVRLRQLWHDIEELDKRTGGSGNFTGVAKEKNVRTKQMKRKEDALSPQDTQSLCCVLMKEIQVYQRLILMGGNLHGFEKEEALMDIYQTCQATPEKDGLVAWDQWQDAHCPGMKQLFAT